MQKIINHWKKYAKKNEDRNFNFLTKLKHKRNQKCGNCCKTSSATITNEDLKRISKTLNLSEEAFKLQYLEQDAWGELKISTLPCPFLGIDNVCSIYEDRPADCREFPHTDKPEFSSRRYMHSANTVDCPAVFYIVERLRQIR